MKIWLFALTICSSKIPNLSVLSNSSISKYDDTQWNTSCNSKEQSDAKPQKLYVQGISEAGGGQTYIISNEDDIPLAFGDALGGLFSIVAEDIDIIFRPQNGAFIKFLRTGGAVTAIDGGGTR